MVIFYNLNLNFSKYNYFLKLKNQFSNFQYFYQNKVKKVEILLKNLKTFSNFMEILEKIQNLK